MLAALAIGPAGTTRFDFSFGAGSFRDDEIFDSATAPPGRYVIELGRRVLAVLPATDHLVIGNPLLPLRAQQLSDWSRGLDGGPAIVTDAAGTFPLLYILPRALFEATERFLLALSTVAAAADARLLGLLAGQPCALQRSTLPALPPGSQLHISGSAWILPVHQRADALRLHCLNTIRLIERNPRWRAAPVATFHPGHAGDVLFWSLASRSVETPLYRSHIVCQAYRDVAEAGGTRLDLIELRLPPLSQDPRIAHETRYFGGALEQLGPDFLAETAVIFTRFLRQYAATPFHLIDQARFSLGDGIASAWRTIQHIATAPDARCALPPTPFRVLLHLDGAGWPLKNYPLADARVLCHALTQLGCAVTVIGQPGLGEVGARSIACGTAASLKAAIMDHHLFVGVDSLPHHFARHVMGWPTIGLFGSTKPCNSDAVAGPAYRSLGQFLPCNPCGGSDSCAVRGGSVCDNHAEPAEIIGAIAAIAREVYGIEDW